MAPDVNELTRDNLCKRLKRVEGQVKGIRRMVEEGKNCQDILTQVAAARAALKMVGQVVLKHRAAQCFEKTTAAASDQEKIDELEKLITVITRFSE
ncbi:MAG: metal-sensitive transcriptional regulator [Bacillota bacterium]